MGSTETSALEATTLPISTERPRATADLLRARGWIDADEHLETLAPAGEGNMNVTLRAVTDRRRLVVKHAPPWVARYPIIEAPPERLAVEHAFYERIRSSPAVAERTPALVGFDPEVRVLALEDLGEAADRTGLYAGEALADEELDTMGRLAAAVHAHGGGADDGTLANRSMRRLNHEHVFRVPWEPGAVASFGLDLDRFEPGLARVAERLQHDEALRREAAALGERYLADGPRLLHGDYFPGSFLRTRARGDPEREAGHGKAAGGLYLIDPEFAHFGEPAFDVGVLVAHLALAGRPEAEARRVVDAYAVADDAPELDERLLAGFAACEVIRRLIGVAQLPLAASDGRRAELLERAARVLRGERGWHGVFG